MPTSYFSFAWVSYHGLQYVTYWIYISVLYLYWLCFSQIQAECVSRRRHSWYFVHYLWSFGTAAHWSFSGDAVAPESSYHWFHTKGDHYLVEKEFSSNVSITENTAFTGNVAFQVNRILGGASSHGLPLLQSPSASQASSLPASMALSPTPSVGLSDAQTGPTSPSTAVSKKKELDIECVSKTHADI